MKCTNCFDVAHLKSSKIEEDAFFKSTPNVYILFTHQIWLINKKLKVIKLFNDR